MYRSADKKKIDDFREYCKNNKLDDAANAYRNYIVNLYINDLYSYMREKTGETVKVSYGNCTADVVILMPDEDRDAIKLSKMICSKIKVDYYDTYIAITNKVSNNHQKLNTEILLRELKIIKPKVIINFDKYFSSNDYNVVNLDINNYIDATKLSAKENKTEEENKIIEKFKTTLITNIKQIYAYTKGK